MTPPTNAKPEIAQRSPATFARTFGAIVLSSALASGCGGGETSPSTSGGAAGTSGGSGGTTGGSAGGKATGGSGGTAGAGQNHFTINVSLSTAIATVGIVEWSIDVPIDSAVIDFGRDAAAFEYQAPVNLTKPSYRTLLLGMKPDTTYSLRITAQGGGTTYTSDVLTVQTGFLPNGLPELDVSDMNPSALYAGGGFTANCTGLSGGPGLGNPSTRSWAFIYDKDGDQVWAYDLTDTEVSGCSRARMSVDGDYMWAGNFNNAMPNGYLFRVSMDGLGTPQTYSCPGRNHDFAFLPSGNVLYWEQQNGGGYTDGKEGPDYIMELDPATSEKRIIYDQMRDFAEQINDSQGAHTNQVNYVPELNAISFSMRHTSTIGLISYPGAELLAVFGGPISTFDIEWDIQHGHHVLADHLFIFNNNGSNGGSSILGFDFNIAASTATERLDYSSGRSSGAFGDVKELPNGNIFVTYSTSGVFHEITATGQLLREVSTSDSLGYSEHRRTLYGAPPPFGE